MKSNKSIMLVLFLLFTIALVYGCQPTGDKDRNEDARLASLQDENRALREALRDALNQPTIPTIPQPPVNNRPEILVTEPDPGENIQSDNFLVRWTASDRDNDQLLITLEFRRENSASFVPIASLISNSGQFIWDVSGITDGAFTLKATVTDGELEDSFTTGVFSINRN